MATARSIVLNGDLGSGKSTVSVMLARRLGIRRISVGELYRDIAKQRGMTALQLNLHAELDDTIDSYVDRLQSDIAASGEQLVVDSRLAWFFFRDALKVHLITEPTVAAHRVMGRPGDAVESYSSVGQARRRLASRSESERTRFLTRYGADKARLRNYDVVIDSTSATPEEIVERIVDNLAEPRGETVLYIDPRRIVADGEPVEGAIRLVYVRPDFFAVRGHDRVAAAVRDGLHLVEATLAAEAEEWAEPGAAEDDWSAPTETEGTDPDAASEWTDPAGSEEWTGPGGRSGAAGPRGLDARPERRTGGRDERVASRRP